MHQRSRLCILEVKGSNRGPTACKAVALQLSYTPNSFVLPELGLSGVEPTDLTIISRTL